MLLLLRLLALVVGSIVVGSVYAILSIVRAHSDGDNRVPRPRATSISQSSAIGLIARCGDMTAHPIRRRPLSVRLKWRRHGSDNAHILHECAAVKHVECVTLAGRSGYLGNTFNGVLVNAIATTTAINGPSKMRV